MKFVFTAMFVIFLARASGAVEVNVSGGIDTSDAEIKSVYSLWTGYLDSRPDLMWRDNEWNGKKSRFWRDFDLTAPFVYTFDLNVLPRSHRPVVLAIERESDLYSIRTLFYRDSSGEDPVPWAIVRVYAQRESGRWKLRNALGVLTADWNRPAIGKITFVTPPRHRFDVELARRSVVYCDSVAVSADVQHWDPFRFYIAGSAEDADRLIGLEFHYGGSPGGRAMRYHDILITGAGREWYRRGLEEMVVPANP